MCKIRQRDRDFILTVIILKGKKTKKINREKASKRNDVLSFALAQRSATYLEMLLTLSTMAVHSCY
jgi:ssRNA-specific RNase YbeY (16S rRNA maturation enzyme)